MKLIKTKLQNGMVLWYRSDDKFVGQRIALEKYEEYESKLILRNVNKNSVAVDVGANIGYYTLLLAKICKKVYAFEPDKNCFEILVKNIKENKLNNVVAMNKAVSDKEGKEYFMVDKENLGNSRIDVRCQMSDVRKIETISLNSLFKNIKIDLIKIDTQGWEPKVVKGAKRIIKKYRPILFLEYSPKSYVENNLDGKTMINFLRQIYKNIFTIDYWFYYYKKGIKIDTKTDYADLVMGIKHNIFFQYKNLAWKKIIKKILSYNELWRK
jgi:FkbM family methyltransferase